MQIQINRASSVNEEKLKGEIAAQFPSISGVGSGPGFVTLVFPDDVILTGNQQQTINALVAGHDASMTAAQQADAEMVVARDAALSQAKTYLRNQLRSASPNANTICAQIKTFVDANPVLAQMVSNQAALMAGPLGWVLSSVLNPAVGALGATDRQRYIFVVEQVISLLE